MCATNTEPVLWSPGAATTEPCGVTTETHPPWSHVAQQEKPVRQDVRRLHLEGRLHSPPPEKSLSSEEDPAQPK